MGRALNVNSLRTPNPEPSHVRPAAHPQKGKFYAERERQGTENFPVPYESPPNVELSGDIARNVTIVETMATAFKWKHVGSYNGEVTWTAKGIVQDERPK